jgi:hypothetical protein
MTGADPAHAPCTGDLLPTPPSSADPGSAERRPDGSAAPGATEVDLPAAEAESATTASGPGTEPSGLAGVESTLATILERLDRDAERATFRERVIDRLYADVERMRAAERGGVLRPVVVDLCRLRNDMLRQARTLPEDMSAVKTAALLDTFAGAVEDALDRCGVVVAHTASGAPFTAGHHQVARTVEGPDAALDGTIAAIVQDGYVEIDSEKVVVPSRVAVYRAIPAPASENTGPTSGPDGIPGADTSQKETTDE